MVLLADSDNELLINLKNNLGVGMFIPAIKKRSSIVLKEYLYAGDGVVKDREGDSYANEFIGIISRDYIDEENQNSRPLQKPENEGVKRTFSIGSEWLYYKFYCGINTADKILENIIGPLVRQLLSEKLIDKWFFIRYADPDCHLRIRLHLSDAAKLGSVVLKLTAAIADYEQTGLIRKVQTDTYQRELERYGINTMQLAETLFFLDSASILRMLELNLDEETKWIFAIKSIDSILNDFGLSMAQKCQLLNNLNLGFEREFGIQKPQKLQMDKKYREKKSLIFDILDPENETISHELVAILEQKSDMARPVVIAITDIIKNSPTAEFLNEFLSSNIHMTVNRIFKGKQRMVELLIYNYMWRTYHSIQEKLKKSLSYS
jgi:thiopeptide-type bacteriocin biosynthesis protein